jgi:hypothetical protein
VVVVEYLLVVVEMVGSGGAGQLLPFLLRNPYHHNPDQLLLHLVSLQVG